MHVLRTNMRRLWPQTMVAGCLFFIIVLLPLKNEMKSGSGRSRTLSTTMGHERVTKQHAPTCNDGTYSKHTLQLAYELPFAGLFNKYNRGRQKYEASSVIIVREILAVLFRSPELWHVRCSRYILFCSSFHS